MRKLLFTSIAILFAFVINAQSLGKVKITNKTYGLGKMKKASKKIYINSFNVNFEVYKEAINFKSGGNGGRLGGGITTGATAEAAVGLGGIDANVIQQKTNELFANYTSRLKKEGYEIISSDEAGKTAALNKWEKASGPYIIENRKGIMTCAPENYSFYFKSEGVLGLGGTGVQAKLSKELGDVIIADVNLHVMFSESGSNIFEGRGAKVKILTNLRLIDNYIVSIPKRNKKKKSTVGKLFGSVKIKGESKTYPINSSITFSYGKTGLGSKAQYIGTLKENIEINDVLKKQKVIAYQKQGSARPGSFASFSISNLDNKFSKTTKWIDVDGDKYAEGFYNSCNTFLEKQLDEFFKKIK